MRERRGGGGGQPARGVENRSARGRGRDGCPCRRAAAAAARVARASERARENRTVGVGNRGGGGGGGGDGFFQSSNLLNLFFPRNVAAVSKLLIAIRGWRRRRRRWRVSRGHPRGDALRNGFGICGGGYRYERGVLSLVSFRFVSPRPRFATLRYVCSAVHLLAQYRGGIIITAASGTRGAREEEEEGGGGEREREKGSQSGFNDCD